MAKVASSPRCDEFPEWPRWNSIACNASHLGARRSRYADRQFSNRSGVSMVDKSMTGTFQLNLPKELLSESKRQPKPKNEELKVEGWRSSWLSKFSEILVGKD
jgi:hypothetical protein